MPGPAEAAAAAGEAPDSDDVQMARSLRHAEEVQALTDPTLRALTEVAAPTSARSLAFASVLFEDLRRGFDLDGTLADAESRFAPEQEEELQHALTLLANDDAADWVRACLGSGDAPGGPPRAGGPTTPAAA